MTKDLETEPPTPPRRRTDLLLAIVLLGVAGYLVASRWTTARVDWYLGDLRRDPGDPDAKRSLRQMGENAMPRIAEELRTGDPNSRVIAVIAAGSIEGQAAEEVLAAGAHDEDPLTASNAIAMASFRTDARTGAAIEAGLTDGRWPVRLAARRAASRRSRGLPWWAFGTRRQAGAPAAAGGEGEETGNGGG